MSTAQFTQGFQRSGLVTGAAVLMIIAGLIHIVIAPTHWSHAPAHGLFFVIMGLAQIVWGLLFWRFPSASLYQSGIILAGSLLTLWVITRLLPAPFEHAPGTIDLAGILCKTSELLGIALLVAIVLAGVNGNQQRRSVWRGAVILMLVAFIGGWVTYGVGYALEPMFPTLQGSAEHVEDAGHEHQTDHDGDSGRHTTEGNQPEGTPEHPEESGHK